MSTKALARPRRPRRSAKRHSMNVGTDYLRLIRAFPLCPLRSDRAYEKAAEILDALSVRPEGSLSVGQQAYMETLTLLIQAFDEERFKIVTSKMGPLAALKYLMTESGMTDGQLGELLGNRALASLIVNGHRGLSKAHIRLLSEHFKVEPGLFLESKSPAKRESMPRTSNVDRRARLGLIHCDAKREYADQCDERRERAR